MKNHYQVAYGVLDRESNVDLFPQTHDGSDYETLVRTAQNYVSTELPQRLYKTFFYCNGVQIGSYVRAELFELLKPVN